MTWSTKLQRQHSLLVSEISQNFSLLDPEFCGTRKLRYYATGNVMQIITWALRKQDNLVEGCERKSHA